MLQSSKLLPATIAAIAAVLAVRSMALVNLPVPHPGAPVQELAPTPDASLAASWGMIGEARAAAAEGARPGSRPGAAAPARPSLPNVSPSVAAAPAAIPASVVPTAPAAQADAGGDAIGTVKLYASGTEDRERQLAQREAAVAAADKRLADRVAELGALQARLQSLMTGLQERDEANWSGLVKMYEGMRPAEAATIFNALDKPVLLDILDRMKPAKAAPVIAAMEAEKARQITADLAQRRTRSVTAVN